MLTGIQKLAEAPEPFSGFMLRTSNTKDTHTMPLWKIRNMKLKAIKATI